VIDAIKRSQAEPGNEVEIRTNELIMFGAHLTEIIVVALIVFLLFGNRLPSVMRSLGKGITEFKKGVQGIQDDVENADKKKLENKEEMMRDKR
jgi:sec-independent protein translocase protein TatA